MPLLKFRVYWEEDDLIYRDIEILSNQTFLDLHQAIIKSYDFDGKHTAVFYESNDRWQRFRALASDVLVNKKDAPALSMIKTPVSALVAVPDQKFVYVYDPAKMWTFLVELIGVTKQEDVLKLYPSCSRKEGMSPNQYGVRGGSTDLLLEVEEKYDLGSDEMAEGFGDEGDSDSDASEDEVVDDNGGNDDY
jgi:hypothetical protein